MKVKLIANGSRPWERWIRRWGLSFLVGDDILFDAFGDARVLMNNLRRFKVDVPKINHVVISHEHWDHIGGLRYLLSVHRGIKVYLPAHVSATFKEHVQAWGGDVVNVSGALRIKEGIHTTGEIMGHYAGQDMPEQGLVLETKQGLVLVAGCAHPGVVSMVQAVTEAFSKPVFGVMGGFHLKDHAVADITMEVTRLKAAGVRMVTPLHCTGARAVHVFRRAFGDGCQCLREGQEHCF